MINSQIKRKTAFSARQSLYFHDLTGFRPKIHAIFAFYLGPGLYCFLGSLVPLALGVNDP